MDTLPDLKCCDYHEPADSTDERHNSRYRGGQDNILEVCKNKGK